MRRLEVPTLVIHGGDDPLVPVEAGRETAAAIPGAGLQIYPGIGHDLPVELLEDMSEEITNQIHHSEQSRAPPATGLG